MFQLTAGAQALLQVANALLEQACGIDRQHFTVVVIEAVEVHPQRRAELLPETFMLAFYRSWLDRDRRLGRRHQFRH
ncbi:hypothetical protein D3C76_1756070 [compost metagenome]